MIANNIKELRISFLLSPGDLARRIGIYPEYIARLESGDRTLSELWIDAVARALGVPREAVTAANEDLFRGAHMSPEKLPKLEPPVLCPVGARFAVLSLIAKSAGLKSANGLSEDDLADAVLSLVTYVGRERDRGTANRLSQGLQITALTILQSCLPDPPEDFQEMFARALPGALGLLEAYSGIVDREPER
ncbi:MAG: helix-turn-helix transcriptional regulator [Oricola sp.]|jgi:DNA-binding XRE family transcriptional regulator|nr:helix-turn-helix transcriptional regulator [Oricola sp.]